MPLLPMRTTLLGVRKTLDALTLELDAEKGTGVIPRVRMIAPIFMTLVEVAQFLERVLMTLGLAIMEITLRRGILPPTTSQERTLRALELLAAAAEEGPWTT